MPGQTPCQHYQTRMHYTRLFCDVLDSVSAVVNAALAIAACSGILLRIPHRCICRRLKLNGPARTTVATQVGLARANSCRSAWRVWRAAVLTVAQKVVMAAVLAVAQKVVMAARGMRLEA